MVMLSQSRVQREQDNIAERGRVRGRRRVQRGLNNTAGKGRFAVADVDRRILRSSQRS